MARIRRLIVWCLGLVLLAGIGAGVYLYSLWAQSDEILRQRILAGLQEAVPHCRFELDRAHFDFRRTVNLYGLTVYAGKNASRIAVLPKTVVSIDHELMAERQEVLVRKISFHRPEVALIRDESRQWNWEALIPDSRSENDLPEFEIEGGQLAVHLRNVGAPPISVSLDGLEIQLIPAGFRQFLVQANTRIEEAGRLELKGRWDVDRGTGVGDGRWHELLADTALLRLVGTILPELDSQLHAATTPPIEMLPPPPETMTSPLGPNPFQTAVPVASRQRDVPVAVISDSTQPADRSVAETNATGETKPTLSALLRDGVEASAQLDIDFHVERTVPKSMPTFKTLVQIRGGQVNHPDLPFAVSRMEGKVYCDNDQFLIRELQANHGTTQLRISGRVPQGKDFGKAHFDVEIQRLLLDYRVRRVLWGKLAELYDELQPAGHVDLKFKLNQAIDPAGESSWQTSELIVMPQDASVIYRPFPYPVDSVRGNVRQEGDLLILDLDGHVSGQPVSLKGTVKDPGPTAQAQIDIQVRKLPLGRQLIQASPPEVSRQLQALHWSGQVDANVRLTRPAGVDQKWTIALAGRFSDAGVQHEDFPYRLQNLTGVVKYSTRTKLCTLEEVQAETSGGAKFSGSAAINLTEDAQTFDLLLRADNARLDRNLAAALPAEMQAVWNELSPRGEFDAVIRYRWTTDVPFDLTLSEVNLRQGGLLLAGFPYPLNELSAQLSYADGLVEFTNLSCRNSGTQFRGEGYVRLADDGWTCRLANLTVDDLVIDRTFREALPPDLRMIASTLNPRGPLSTSGMVEFRGTGRADDPLTAAWDLETVMTGTTITAGIDLEKMHGTVKTRGTWDGQRAVMDGKFKFDSMSVWEYQISHVQGPFQLVDRQLTLGAPNMLLPRPPQTTPDRETVSVADRVTGKAFDGVLTLDGDVLLRPQPAYHLILTLSGARLEEYARRHLRNDSGLKGIVRAWVDLQGRGSSAAGLSGRGQVQISPASLYELPIIVQIFKVLSFVPVDKTAFNYVMMDFDIGHEQFQFKSIDMVGDALRLRGRGMARFDGRVSLDFYTMLPRNSLPIPIVDHILGEATKGWVGVEVRGTTENAVARVKPVPSLDGALKRFLMVLERPPTMPQLAPFIPGPSVLGLPDPLRGFPNRTPTAGGDRPPPQ